MAWSPDRLSITLLIRKLWGSVLIEVPPDAAAAQPGQHPALAYARNPVDEDSKAKPPPPVGQAWSAEHFIQAEEFRKHGALVGIKKDMSQVCFT